MESTTTLVFALVSLGWRHELPPAEAHLSALVLEHLLGGTSLILTSWLLLVEVKRYLRPTFVVILSIWLILVSTLSFGLISRLLLPVIIIGDFIIAIILQIISRLLVLLLFIFSELLKPSLEPSCRRFVAASSFRIASFGTLW